jgi:glucoamylase
MIPEQVWDAEPIPERFLLPGRPTGSAMPLVWAHAEFIKLAVSRALGRPFDRPEPLWRRYGGKRPKLRRLIWAPHAPASSLPQGAALTLALNDPGVFRWGFDGWQDIEEKATRPNPLGLHLVEIDTGAFAVGRVINLTYRRLSDGQWAGQDFQIEVTAARN